MKKLLIIDGSSLLFQSFYGMPNQIKNKDGKRVEAVICFVGILQKTIKAISPDKLLIVFDGENDLVRREVDVDYKSNRIDYTVLDSEDTPFPQLEIIKQVLTQINYSWVETTDCEADDLIASVVNDYKDDMSIVVSTMDKDFYQLVCDNVSVFTYRGKLSTLWTDTTIKNKYGFDAKYFGVYKSLVGDSSDNIKGVSGIGSVTATNLISNYGDIDNIYTHIADIKEKIRVLLEANKTKVYQNYKIIDLTTISGLYTINDCDYNKIDKTSTQLLKECGVM